MLDFLRVIPAYYKALLSLSVFGLWLVFGGFFFICIGIMMIVFGLLQNRPDDVPPRASDLPGIQHPLPPGPPSSIAAVISTPSPPIPPPPSLQANATRVIDQAGRVAELVRIVSPDYNWVYGESNLIESSIIPTSFDEYLQMDGIKKYLGQFHAIVGVGSASNESEAGIAAEEDRALRRARYLRTKLRGVLSTDAVYYRLSLGWNSQVPAGLFNALN